MLVENASSCAQAGEQPTKDTLEIVKEQLRGKVETFIMIRHLCPNFHSNSYHCYQSHI